MYADLGKERKKVLKKMDMDDYADVLQSDSEADMEEVKTEIKMLEDELNGNPQAGKQGGVTRRGVSAHRTAADEERPEEHAQGAPDHGDRDARRRSPER